MNLYTIFQCAQLLQRFSAFQRTRLPAYKLEQRLASETVDSLVTEQGGALSRSLLSSGGGLETAASFRLEWDRSTREIKSAAAKIENDFHLVRRKSVRWLPEWMCSRHDFRFTIRTQFFDKLVDQPRIDQRFVALDINYVCELLCFPRDFGHSVGTAAVFRRSQRDFCAPIKRGRRDPHVVGSNDNQIQTFSAAATLPNMFQKRFSSNGMQWFPRKSRGTPPGGNNSDRFTHARDR